MNALNRVLDGEHGDPAVAGSILTIAVGTVLSLVFYKLVFGTSTQERAVDFTVPAPEAIRAGWQGPQLDSPSIKVQGSTAIQCYAPATGQFLGLINPATPDGIDRIVAKASAAQAKWRETTFAQRRQLLQTLLKFMLDHQDEIVRAACRDSGKTRVDAMFGEVLVTAVKLRWTIQHGEAALRPDRRPTNLMMFYKQNEIHYEPLGVIAACVSWKCVLQMMCSVSVVGSFDG
jgi:acyl-CoA reductase-like NAD-dependent aldehyde dehydrogenase